jgi:glutamate synthase domain-containing protein 3
MNALTRSEPIEGYRKVAPAVTTDGDTVCIDATGVYYRQLNEAVRSAFDGGARTVRLTGVNGQRYIGTGIAGADRLIEVEGTPGNDLAMFMDGPVVVVRGNAQHGDAGDVLGYGMRGGKVLVRGDVGYRVGIHMKAFESNVPVMVCGGKARDFFGEYMAGGLLVLLGMETQFEDQPLVGSFCGTGMHGGTIFLRGEVEPWQVGKECGMFVADEDDLATLRPLLSEWCEAFGRSLDEVLAVPFTKLVPVSHRPYGKLYANT